MDNEHLVELDDSHTVVFPTTPSTLSRSGTTLLNLTALSEPTRTKALRTENAVNALLGAAANLLSMLSKLREQEKAPQLSELQRSLVHEIKAFETESFHANYSTDIILASRYVLCVAIDETIDNTNWGVSWQGYRLLTHFHLEDWNGDNFFQLLEKLSQGSTHIDLLELMYLCLSFGFEGKYREQKNGAKELLVIRDRVYQAIQRARGDVDKR